jgi:hypothetical protein
MVDMDILQRIADTSDQKVAAECASQAQPATGLGEIIQVAVVVMLAVIQLRAKEVSAKKPRFDKGRT